MSFERKRMFVLTRHGGPEGYSPPVWAFSDHSEALAALALIKAMTDGTWQLFIVPLYPSMPNTAWYQLKPHET